MLILVVMALAVGGAMRWSDSQRENAGSPRVLTGSAASTKAPHPSTQTTLKRGVGSIAGELDYRISSLSLCASDGRTFVLNAPAGAPFDLGLELGTSRFGFTHVQAALWGSAGWQSGLRPGDVITKVADMLVPTASPDAVLDVINTSVRGTKEVRISVLRRNLEGKVWSR